MQFYSVKGEKIKNIVFILLTLFLFIETTYFNVLFDMALVVLLLLTSFSIGSFSKLRLCTNDKIFIQTTIGIGIVGCFVWLTSFYNLSYKSIYLAFSLMIIAVRYKYILKASQSIKKLYSQNRVENPLLFIILISFFLFYTIVASSAINDHDALTKHIAIPLTILNSSHYDYNVIESIVFGDYALLPHMLFLYLLALLGTKAVVLFVMALSFLTLFMLLRIASFISSKNVFINGTALLYLTTPLIFSSSTNLMVDIFPIIFMIASLLVLQYTHNIHKNILFIAMLFGFSMFSKQISAYYIIAMAFIILYFYAKQKILSSRQHILFLLLSLIVCIGIFFPSIFIIWYKTGNPFFPFMNGVFHSPYFSQESFQDPFTNVLGFNLQSLWSIIFDTSNNIEMISGGIGYFLLLLPFSLIFIFMKRNSKIVILLFIALFGYLLAVQLTYNIRYFLISIVLLIPVIMYLIVTVDSRFFSNKNIFSWFFIVILSVFAMKVVFHKDNFWGFKQSMLSYNSHWTDNANESVLKYLGYDKEIKLLSNNDQLRGVFIGRYYGLGWYNEYLVEQFNKSQLTPYEFMTNFDYYMINKSNPLKMKDQFSPNSIYLKDKLELIHESETHILYKIKKDEVVILQEKLDSPIKVNVQNAKTLAFKNVYTNYRIVLTTEVYKTHTMGRFQINWMDEKGNFLGASIEPFDITANKNTYTSSMIQNIPDNATEGILYLNSHNNDYILVHSYELSGKDKGSLVEKLEKTYGDKFPSIAKDKHND